MDRLEIGPTPSSEPCEQMGPNYSPTRAKQECRAFINQLIRQHGENPEGTAWRITANAHDFGTYHEVAIYYNEDSKKAVDYAFKVEGDIPEYWDAEAKKELGISL